MEELAAVITEVFCALSEHGGIRINLAGSNFVNEPQHLPFD
jgi:hypothetical protein